MMGHVDHSGRSLLRVTLRSASQSWEVDVWVDTGFTCELVLTQFVIDEWQFTKSGSVDAI